MHSDSSLYDELSRTLHALNAQQRAIHKDVERSLPLGVPVTDAMLYAYKYMDGVFAMPEILAAKANCLHGMAIIKASQKKGK